MVIASHVIITTYGFWLPNDPRGSWSEFVGAWELLRYGKATKVTTRRSVAAARHDHQHRLAAKTALKYPAVEFAGVQARAVARGFADCCRGSGVTLWACSILPKHAHMVVARHAYAAEQVANQLKGAATKRLNHEGLHPLARHAEPGTRPPTPWARGLWKVFLSDDADVRRAVRYVEDNPRREGLRPQRWSFVRPCV